MRSSKPFKVFQVGTEKSLDRLDTWLASKLQGVSKRSVQALIKNGTVLVNGMICPKGRSLTNGDTVELWEAPTPLNWFARPDSNLKLDILYEDPHLCAVNKPAGIPSVPIHPDETNTLAGTVASHFPECLQLQRRPGDAGLIQRLDTQTSGISIAARTKEAFDTLLNAQRNNLIEKTYLALVLREDKPLPPVISKSLESFPGKPSKVRCSESGAPASTILSLVNEHGSTSLIQAVIHHGFRHQIRVHLLNAGFPICGDKLYGGPSILGLDRLFLHASKVILNHPIEDKVIEIEAKLPKELLDVIR